MPSTISKDLAHQLADVETAYGIPADDPLALLTAGLRLHGLVVEEVGDLSLGDKKPWTRGRGYGPYVWLWSHDGRGLRDEAWRRDNTEGFDREASNEKMIEANLRDRGRLIDLLGEFYSNRRCAAYVRLVISDMAVGSSLLKSQGADVIALPDNEPQRAAWLEKARHEMADFAGFLVARLDAATPPPHK